jgi:hypothetical protein
MAQKFFFRPWRYAKHGGSAAVLPDAKFSKNPNLGKS